MQIKLFPASGRGHADHGWLNAYHSFSFAGWYDPDLVHFGLLRVLNDDTIAGGMGFGKHPHDNMEIVTIPLEGALQHSDSTGRTEVIRKGEVQIMSAGSGIFHSEVNASKSDPVKLFQIWVFPKLRNIAPRYDQKVFDEASRENRLCTVVSPDGNEGSLQINQDAWFSLGRFSGAQKIEYTIHRKGNGVFLMIVDGNASVEGNGLAKRDAIGLWETEKFTVDVKAGCEVLLIEIPMN
ncbi:MAG TPA: pirin family protein [Bacteroidia bacterium]|nr:pirin family protein [Bacteroidia bacterium]